MYTILSFKNARCDLSRDLAILWYDDVHHVLTFCPIFRGGVPIHHALLENKIWGGLCVILSHHKLIRGPSFRLIDNLWYDNLHRVLIIFSAGGGGGGSPHNFWLKTEIGYTFCIQPPI